MSVATSPEGSPYETLQVWRDGHVGWLVFDRPTARNALDAAMFGELEAAWRALDADPEVRVIVNAGNGEDFQTGLDLVQLARDPDALRRFSRQTRDAALRFTSWHLEVWKPVIAAVHGRCAGGGLHFVADADIVVMAADAELVDPHVSVGQVTAFEGITLVRTSPAEPILRMALVGRHERMGAERARQLGIASEVVDPPDRLRAVASELAHKIARNSPAAMAATKKALWGALDCGLTEACHRGAQHLVALWDHPDQVEGPAAWAEHRDARWAPVSATGGNAT